MGSPKSTSKQDTCRHNSQTHPDGEPTECSDVWACHGSRSALLVKAVDEWEAQGAVRLINEEVAASGRVNAEAESNM